MKHIITSILLLNCYLLHAQTQLGSDIDGEAAYDGSGGSVSMNSAGDRVAIGAPYNDGTATNAGHVRIYQYSNSSWTQLGTDIDGEAEGDWSGHSVSMNSAGDRVAIGAYKNDGTGNEMGHVRVYGYSNGSWTQLGSDIDGEEMMVSYDWSGRSVSMNSAGDRVAIGAPGNDGNGGSAGHVRVYEYSDSSWTQFGSDIDSEAPGEFFGISVSMNSTGDRVAIGASDYDEFNGGWFGDNMGQVRVYEYSNGSWTQLGSDIDGEAEDDRYGWSVSINSAGDRVAIGAYYNDGTGNDAGHVRVYEYSNSSWTQLGSDIDGEAADDRSGYSVSIDSAGDRVAIGAYYNDGTGNNAGHVRVYEYSNSSWTQVGSDIDGEAAGDRSGWSVSMNLAGDRVAIRAPGNDGNGGSAGHVRVYGLVQYTPDPPTLVINELLGQNVACCTDANGDYDGYIELFNYGDEEVDIGGMVITDEYDYYQIPANNDSTIILPGGFLLLWADEESEQGVLHVEIELFSRGGEVGLFMADSTTVVDNITYGSQSSDDVAYGRYPDSSATWQLMNPTPGATNTQELSLNDNIVIPSQYTLHQNYPNPFNPVTTLRYDLPENGMVNITIYDMLGREVKTLINQTQDAGYKSVIWDATNDYGKPVSAGIYLYQIQAGEYISTKKMVLLK